MHVSWMMHITRKAFVQAADDGGMHRYTFSQLVEWMDKRYPRGLWPC